MLLITFLKNLTDFRKCRAYVPTTILFYVDEKLKIFKVHDNYLKFEQSYYTRPLKATPVRTADRLYLSFRYRCTHRHVRTSRTRPTVIIEVGAYTCTETRCSVVLPAGSERRFSQKIYFQVVLLII